MAFNILSMDIVCDTLIIMRFEFENFEIHYASEKEVRDFVLAPDRITFMIGELVSGTYKVHQVLVGDLNCLDDVCCWLCYAGFEQKDLINIYPDYAMDIAIHRSKAIGSEL